MIKKFWLTLLPALMLVLLAACSAITTQPESELSDLDIQVRQTPESVEPSPDELLSVHFIDVGEGDAILVVQGSYAMLVDGGPAEMGAIVFNCLRSQGEVNFSDDEPDEEDGEVW